MRWAEGPVSYPDHRAYPDCPDCPECGWNNRPNMASYQSVYALYVEAHGAV